MNVKRTFLVLLASIVGAGFFFLFFSAFYDVLFPYYFEDYLSHFFVIGLGVVCLLPILLARTNLFDKSNKVAFGERYFRAVIGTNVLIALCCIFAFIYMLTNSVYIGDSPVQVYESEPYD